MVLLAASLCPETGLVLMVIDGVLQSCHFMVSGITLLVFVTFAHVMRMRRCVMYAWCAVARVGNAAF